ncbi:hypothetical protein KAH37_07480 [bacterium]|nr:hypothetical protein [bacterium]
MTESWLHKLKTVLNKDVSVVFKDVSQVLTTDIGDLIDDRRAQAILSLIQKTPSNFDLYASLATLYIEMGKEEKALQIYYEIAEKSILIKQHDKALSLIRRGLEMDSSHPGLLTLKGDCALRENRPTVAISLYREAADNYAKQEDIDTAIFLLHKLIGLGSRSRRDRLHLSALYIHTQQFDDSIKMLDPLIEELRRGTAAALPMLETALQFRFTISEIDLGVGEKYLQVLLVREKYPQVLLIAEKILNKHPNEILILRKQLLAYEKLKKRDDAIVTCKKIAHIYADKGNLAKKKIYLAKVLQFDNRDVEALLQLGSDKTIQQYVNRAISETESNFKWIKQGDSD